MINPLSRSDRINFPQVSPTTWQFQEDDSFSTPEQGSSDDVCFEDWHERSTEACQVAYDSSDMQAHGLDYFRTKELRGLVTPAGIPDFLQRGSLYDPDQSGSSSSSSQRTPASWNLPFNGTASSNGSSCGFNSGAFGTVSLTLGSPEPPAHAQNSAAVSLRGGDDPSPVVARQLDFCREAKRAMLL
mmetsp:Transcript_112351/g.177614  ORF Transcript_112351/g.177614 Transcript_112351/m.177614 type:complete len:186 (+) Transcript_112351:54-611(+)